MIRTLQKKFVLSAMLAISILLFGLLGSINILNATINVGQTNELTEMLLAAETSPMPQMPHRGEKEHWFLDRPMTENTRMSSIYFVTRVDSEGNFLKVDVSRIANVTEEEAKALTETVTARGKVRGRISGFHYCSAALSDGQGTVWLFLDTFEQTMSITNLLLLSILIGATCWLLMLLLVLVLSGRAIRPIAVNLERQKQFVTDAGHEIKTPLAIILANTEAMELHNGENKWSRNIREQVTRLSGLTQNLLTLAKLDESNNAATRQPLSLSDLTIEGSDMFREAMELKALHLERHIQPDLTFSANKELMMRLISVLLDNAVKYAPTGGKVVLELFGNDKTIQLIVANDCEKLPDCPPERLFDRFYRADLARTQKNGGYGIGLSAAQSIVEAHGGTISAAYEGEHTVVFFVIF